MGTPIALNLVYAGQRVVVWNQTPERCTPLAEPSADVTPTTDDLFTRCETVLLMLENERATDAVLGRGTDRFAERVGGPKTLRKNGGESGLRSPPTSCDGCFGAE
ncbi:MAG: hypothetical protein CMH13_17480 [Martelella sp.]|nr:hypothetical protein [Martelella sp.]